jgi:hypothetical protein
MIRMRNCYNMMVPDLVPNHIGCVMAILGGDPQQAVLGPVSRNYGFRNVFHVLCLNDDLSDLGNSFLA